MFVNKFRRNSGLLIVAIFVVLIFIKFEFILNLFNYLFGRSVAKYIGAYVPIKSKYIIYSCDRSLCGGWGDRMKGISSLYMWSVLTNRTFLIYMNRPCDVRHMLEPNTVDWTVDNVYAFENVTFQKMDLIDESGFRESLQTINLLEYERDKDVIIVEANQDWLYSMSQNPNLKARLNQLGFVQDQFRQSYQFDSVYKRLFKLKPHLEERYQDFLRKAKPNPKTTLICVQVRVGGTRPNVANDYQFMIRNNTVLFWKYIERKILPLYKNKDYKIFITTDTETVEKEGIEYFGHQNVITINGEFAHIDRESNNHQPNCTRIDKVILDFHALQNCDESIISCSGFSRLGVMNRANKSHTIHMFDYDELIFKEYKFSDYTDLT